MRHIVTRDQIMKEPSEIDYANVAEALVEAVPDVRGRYEEERCLWGDEKPGPHIIFGDVLTPYLIDLLNLERQEGKLREVFEFLERLANHPDVHIQELVAVTVCERLGDYREHLKKAYKFMGPRTRQFSEEIEAFWGRRPCDTSLP
jgi:hypothetical protein